MQTSTAAAIGSMFSIQNAWIWCIIVSVVLIIGSYISISKFAGSKDDWNQIQGQMTGVIVMVFIGVLAFVIGMIILVNYSGGSGGSGDIMTKYFYSTIAISAISLLVSTISLCVSVVAH